LDLHAPIQRYLCLKCGRSWSEKPPWLMPRRWYGRDVIRKTLDLYVGCGPSWRAVVELVRAEVTGMGRALLWAPWRQPRQGAERVKLSHTTGWRWLKMAGGRATEPERIEGRYQGLFGGILSTDETTIWVRGRVDGVRRKVEQGVQALMDGASRLILALRRLPGESEEALRAGVERLPDVGVRLGEIRVWLSDGLATYKALLEMMDLGAVPRQRSVFHLWRNVLGVIREYGGARGEEAGKALKAAIRAVWDAGSERAAVVALMELVKVYGEDAIAGRAVWIVRTTFKEATFHLKGMVEGLARTSGVVEWLWRRYKRRVRLIECFLGGPGADHFLAVYELYVNFERYQVRRERKRHYPYAGQCPLEIAGGQVEVAVGGPGNGIRVVSWLDALGI